MRRSTGGAELVLSGSLDEGAQLWSCLLQLAAENRETGGYSDLLKLERILRLDFEVRDYPDYEVDSEILIGPIPEGRFRSPSEL